jgi:glycerophosphoryl diester phosphodiesterase
VLVVLWAAFTLAAGILNVSLLSLVLLRLYFNAGGSPAIEVPELAYSKEMIRLSNPLRIAAVVVAVLAAIGATLVLFNVARRDQPVVTIAPRGASADAPENTLAAFRLAAEQGADYIELDVQESLDGEVVVVHDSDLMKVGGAPLKIWESKTADLRGVDIGSHKDKRFASERVPTLVEVFQALKGTRAKVIVELKSYGHSQRLEERVIEIVEAAGVEGDTVFMSLNHEMVRRMKQLRPTWRTGVLIARAMGDVTAIDADFLAVQAGLATRRFVRQAHRAGRQVYVWTVNDPAWMLSALSRGVDGLITDRPDLSRQVIERRSALTDAQRILVALLVVLGAEPKAVQAEEAQLPYVLSTHATLAAPTSRSGSPASGAFLSADERETARRNGIPGPDSGPYLSAQPAQGVSSMVPADAGLWWALADNGYGRRENSADFQLVFHRLDPRWGDAAGVRIVETVVVRDPDRRIPWTIACDPQHGTPLPGFSFNAMPAPPPACGPDPAARVLTGFDLDPESFVRAPDGTFWISDEFGPFLLHVAGDGRLLAPPVQIPGVRSPQNPFLEISGRARAERPTLATSRGFEGMAISPDGSTLYALLEGAVTGDDPRDLRIYTYDIARNILASAFLKVRLEAASQTVNLAGLVDTAGARIYPDAAAPPAGPIAIGELKAVNDHQMLLIERDNLGDDLNPPALKKLFLLELSQADARGGYVGKTQLVDLLAVPDPDGLGGETSFFSLPFYTIESVHVADERTLLVATDNNFPMSNGRSRSRSRDRTGPLAADSVEMVLIRLASPLSVDRRLLGSSPPKLP